jgi:hypothetical protein
MEILSFGIDRAPQVQITRGYAVRLSINLQPSILLSTTVNTFPRS